MRPPRRGRHPAGLGTGARGERAPQARRGPGGRREVPGRHPAGGERRRSRGLAERRGEPRGLPALGRPCRGGTAPGPARHRLPGRAGLPGERVHRRRHPRQHDLRDRSRLRGPGPVAGGRRPLPRRRGRVPPHRSDQRRGVRAGVPGAGPDRAGGGGGGPLPPAGGPRPRRRGRRQGTADGADAPGRAPRRVTARRACRRPVAPGRWRAQAAAAPPSSCSASIRAFHSRLEACQPSSLWPSRQ
ncbi:hypothetical protein SGPA1_20209 [Streptomyces misionensis JCM 4497]